MSTLRQDYCDHPKLVSQVSYEPAELDTLKLCCDLVSQFGNPRMEKQSYLPYVHFGVSICYVKHLGFTLVTSVG